MVVVVVEERVLVRIWMEVVESEVAIRTRTVAVVVVVIERRRSCPMSQSRPRQEMVVVVVAVGRISIPPIPPSTPTDLDDHLDQTRRVVI